MGSKYLGIDIGGTKTNVGIVDEDGSILAKAKFSTYAGACEESIKRISASIKSFLDVKGYRPEDIAFIGAGVPGTVDTRTGFVDYCPNLHWIDEPAGEYFRKHLGREVAIVQDSRAAAFGELLFGAGRGFSDIICLTLGTGIGGGIIVGGKIFNGGMNTAGELGHTPIVKNGKPCVCGVGGCLERYVSGTAILSRALESFPEKFEGREKKSETVFELAYAGDAQALALISDCVDDLAFGIACAVDLLSPQAVVISGGLCEHESLIIRPLIERVPKFGYFSWVKKNALVIKKAELLGDAPMIGAAMLYRSL